VLEHAQRPAQRLGLLLPRSEGRLALIATNGGGLVRFRDGVFHPYTTRDGLSSDIVNITYEDAAGPVGGHVRGGLNRMRGERFTAYTTSEGLYGDDAIFSILSDPGRGRPRG